MRVLPADDHAGVLVAIQNILEPEFEIVGCVDNGESLVEAAKNLQLDVIITDISMPKLSGLEAAKRLRTSGCSSKLVFLTIHTDPDVVRTALETGALGYVAKNSLTTDLVIAIREALQGRAFVPSETSAE